MVINNPFRPKQPTDPAEELVQASTTPFTIPELIADAAARFGDRTAYQQKIEGRWQQLSFEQAWRQAREFAAGLIALGLQKGDRVAIVCENGLPWAIGYLGTSFAGGVCVPLYTELKAPEIETLIKRSGARIIIASAIH